MSAARARARGEPRGRTRPSVRPPLALNWSQATAVEVGGVGSEILASLPASTLGHEEAYLPVDVIVVDRDDEVRRVTDRLGVGAVVHVDPAHAGGLGGGGLH